MFRKSKENRNWIHNKYIGQILQEYIINTLDKYYKHDISYMEIVEKVCEIMIYVMARWSM